MKVTVHIRGEADVKAALERLGDNARGALEDAAQAGADVLRASADKNAPGPHIQTEVVERTRTRAVVAIGPDDDHWYYRFFETGTQPHTISGLLSFQDNGEWVLVRGVDHPGMAAEPFLRPAFDEDKDKAVEKVGDKLRRKMGVR